MSSIFLGRTEEQERFVSVLDQLVAGRGDVGASYVVLVQGLGGIGKSALLGRYRELVEVSGRVAGRSRFLPVRIDWEDERSAQPDEYPGSTGPQVLTVASALYGAAMDAVRPERRLQRHAQKAFDGYRAVVAHYPGLERVGDDHQSLASGGAGSLGDDALGPIGAAAKAAVSIVPGGVALAPVAETVPAALVSARRVLRKHRHGDIDPPLFELLLRPDDALARKLAEGLRDLSRHRAVVILLDTYEIVAASGSWLRTVIGQTGDRVLWVIAGRMEPEAEGGPTGDVARFHRELPEDRLRTIAISRFTDHEVGAFLAHRLGDQVDDAVIGAVSSVTRGIPLSVLLAAGMIRRGVPVDEVARPITTAGDSSEIIRELARRYLIHVMRDTSVSADLPLLYGLALVHGDQSDPELVRAIWGNVTDVAGTLDALAKRHDFVQTESRRIHQQVRDTIRAYLLDAVRRDDVRAMNGRAVEVLRARLVSGPTTVEDQFDDELWRAAATALVWHEFWVGNDCGMRMLRDLLPAARLLQGSFADELLDVANFFAVTLDRRQRATLRGLRHICGWAHGWDPFDEDEDAFGADDTISASPADVARATEFLADDGPRSGLVARDRDPRALVELILGDQRKWIDIEGHRNHLERAAALLEPQGGDIDYFLADSARLCAGELIFANQHGMATASQDGLRIAELATRFCPDDDQAWIILGNALQGLGRFEQALEAMDRAVEIDPMGDRVHNERGVVLDSMGRHEEALAAYERSIQIDPSSAVVHVNRGNLLYQLERTADALRAYDDAIEAERWYVQAHISRGTCLYHLGKLDSSLAAYLEALSIAPGNHEARSSRVVVMFDLDRFQDALDACDEDIMLNADDARAHHYRSVVLFRLGKTDEGLAALARAAELGEDSAAFYSTRASALLATGREDAAMADFERALSIDPNLAQAHSGRGVVLLRHGQYDEARAAFQKGAAVGARSRLGSLVYLGALARRDRPEEALDHFRAAVADPGLGSSPFRRAESYAIATLGLGETFDPTELDRVAHLRSPLDEFRPCLYELLADPPLAGLDEVADRVRALGQPAETT